jgi:hypothetical protein
MQGIPEYAYDYFSELIGVLGCLKLIALVCREIRRIPGGPANFLGDREPRESAAVAQRL